MRRAQQALGHAFKPASAQALLSPSLCGGMQRISVCNGPAASPLWLLKGPGILHAAQQQNQVLCSA